MRLRSSIIVRKFVHQSKKKVYRGGKAITFVGADGSGKSTQSRDLCKWLGWKLDVMYVYFGSGDGSRSLSGRLVGLIDLVASGAWKMLSRYKESARKEYAMEGNTFHGAEADKPLYAQPAVKRGWTVVRSLAFAQEKLDKIQKGCYARNHGVIVITDRYPQNQFKGYNDGPLLDDLKNVPGLWKYAYGLEAKLYDKMLMVHSDLVIKLDISLDAALERKKDTPQDMLLRKIEAVRHMTFAPQTKVVTIDATVPVEEVSLAVKQVVWEAL